MKALNELYPNDVASFLEELTQLRFGSVKGKLAHPDRDTIFLVGGQILPVRVSTGRGTEELGDVKLRDAESAVSTVAL